MNFCGFSFLSVLNGRMLNNCWQLLFTLPYADCSTNEQSVVQMRTVQLNIKPR